MRITNDLVIKFYVFNVIVEYETKKVEIMHSGPGTICSHTKGGTALYFWTKSPNAPKNTP